MHLKALHFAKASVLVLEDDPALRDGLCALLSDEGYRLVDAKADAGTIDLVIAGVGPGRAHDDQLSALSPLDRCAPVIALIDRAGWQGFQFFDAANALGAIAVLRRPFPRAALLRLIGAVLAQADDATPEPEAADEEGRDLAELLLQLENPYFA